ncbi:MAG: UMP kinase, partial [Colwelliaceae bacterium]|nr:UMP kinase [Colwelliaceae bacterium]
LARYLKSDFINLTNVPGLYTSNPKKNKNAKLIPKISWTAFEKKANKLKFKAGQHFVLDQRAASIIRKHKIKTYIIGPDTNQISNLLKGKKFKGTSISG